jgi:hypothetical protein
LFLLDEETYFDYKIIMFNPVEKTMRDMSDAAIRVRAEAIKAERNTPMFRLFMATIALVQMENEAQAKHDFDDLECCYDDPDTHVEYDLAFRTRRCARDAIMNAIPLLQAANLKNHQIDNYLEEHVADEPFV